MWRGGVAVSRPSPEFQLEFLGYLQRIFDEGEFVATYKFALLMALADLAVEKGTDTDGELALTTRDIARKFIVYYQRQARPFPVDSRTGEHVVLHQNTGRQAAVVRMVAEAAPDYEPTLVNRVAETVKQQPLWRLQILGGQAVEFLYPNTGHGHDIRLKPGVMFCLRRFHGFVHDLAKARWVTFVRERRQNREHLGEAVDLSKFMFGAPRTDLAVYRPVLIDIQKRHCFYCSRELNTSEVDHFIPWSRYGNDLGHNFVLACRECNNDKRDLLASERHLERWVRRNDDHGDTLREYFVEHQVDHEAGTSRMITRWAYGQAAMANARVWESKKATAALIGRWDSLLS